MPYHFHHVAFAGKAPKGEMVRIIICKDLFAGCDGEVSPVFAALHAASRSWAGEDQVNQVSIT